MGKSLPNTTRLHNLAKSTTQILKTTTTTTKQPKPTSHNRRIIENNNNNKSKKMETTSTVNQTTTTINNVNESNNENIPLPLSAVVSDCVKRWFKDTLKEAKAGDINMQVLVGQMYYSGYGVPRDEQKGRIWMTRAARIRSSVWKVSEKRPGYNASDSDSDELKGDS